MTPTNETITKKLERLYGYVKNPNGKYNLFSYIMLRAFIHALIMEEIKEEQIISIVKEYGEYNQKDYDRCIKDEKLIIKL